MGLSLFGAKILYTILALKRSQGKVFFPGLLAAGPQRFQCSGVSLQRSNDRRKKAKSGKGRISFWPLFTDTRNLTPETYFKSEAGMARQKV
jgi:hypothetical protein